MPDRLCPSLVRRAVLDAPPRTSDARVHGAHGPNDGHAAAWADGHVAHDADRFASTRDRRAAAARDDRSAGIVSPVPKYISSAAPAGTGTITGIPGGPMARTGRIASAITEITRVCQKRGGRRAKCGIRALSCVVRLHPDLPRTRLRSTCTASSTPGSQDLPHLFAARNICARSRLIASSHVRRPWTATSSHSGSPPRRRAARVTAARQAQDWRRHAFREELARACESFGVLVPA